jgi:hypothetical protein
MRGKLAGGVGGNVRTSGWDSHGTALGRYEVCSSGQEGMCSKIVSNQIKAQGMMMHDVLSLHVEAYKA